MQQLRSAAMKSVAFFLLVAALVVSGCQSTNKASTGQLNVVIKPPSGLHADPQDFRITVDRNYVGNYDSDGIVLELPVGTHTIQVTSRMASQRVELSNGNTLIKTYSLEGEQRVKVLGGGSKQVLIFDSENIKKREIDDVDGHGS